MATAHEVLSRHLRPVVQARTPRAVFPTNTPIDDLLSSEGQPGGFPQRQLVMLRGGGERSLGVLLRASHSTGVVVAEVQEPDWTSYWKALYRAIYSPEAGIILSTLPSPMEETEGQNRIEVTNRIPKVVSWLQHPKAGPKTLVLYTSEATPKAMRFYSFLTLEARQTSENEVLVLVKKTKLNAKQGYSLRVITASPGESWR